MRANILQEPIYEKSTPILLFGKAGILALGIDFSVERVSPFLTLYAAVERQDLEGYPVGGFHMKDALSREETLKGMTLWAACSNFEESEKGSLNMEKWPTL